MSKLKKARLERELTQIDVAKAVGVSLVSYRNWEDGVTTPKDENLARLEQVLGAKAVKDIKK